VVCEQVVLVKIMALFMMQDGHRSREIMQPTTPLNVRFNPKKAWLKIPGQPDIHPIRHTRSASRVINPLAEPAKRTHASNSNLNHAMYIL
jgi:hypothetical protein